MRNSCLQRLFHCVGEHYVLEPELRLERLRMAREPEEIRAAYQKLIQKYHPDRVADLGPELQELAAQRTKELNAAYAALKKG